MKTDRRLEVFPQQGVFIGLPSPTESANRIENFRYDPKNKAWHNQLGYEKLFSNQTAFSPFAGSDQRAVDSIYMFQQHSGAKQQLFYETNGKLYMLRFANNLNVELLDNRKVPTDNEPHTSYEPFGRYVIITNGFDGPVKFRGQQSGGNPADYVYDLGWRTSPGTPSVRIPGPTNSSLFPKTFLESTDTYVSNSGFTQYFEDPSYRGLGTATDEAENRYIYKVTFVNENGSESPLSAPSNDAKWESSNLTRGSTTAVPLPGLIVEIPTGPNGTKARRIYRTTNNTDDYFFCKQINNNSDTIYTDFLSDSQLGAAAPSGNDSVIFPSPSARFTAAFKNVLFVDGGEMDPTRLYYSRPLQPDTYKADDYFEVGTREGGDITALAPYYNSLLVFRENAIDLIRGDAVNGFELVPFIQGVGTLSPHTIVPIPNVGLSFLSQDGIYILKGGLDGGSSLQLQKISQGLQEFFDRLSRDKLPAAVGAYSQRERELHYYMSIDGQPTLNKGIVFHVDNKTFSERDSFPVKCITTDKDGNLIAGYDENNVYSGAPALSTNQEAKGGIFVISGTRQMGYKWSGSAYVDNDDIQSKFRSSWHDFGYGPIKKHVKYVYLYILTKGNVDLALEIYKDRSWANGNQTQQTNLQRADQADQNVYGTNKWNTAVWEDKLLTPLRFDCFNSACTDFAFEFTANQQVEFVGYAIEYTVDNTRIIRGKD